MKRYLLLLLLPFMTCACEVVDYLVPDTSVRGDDLVVEGWIDEGGYPVVSVTTTLRRPDEPQKVSKLASLVLTDARVTVSDGTQTVELYGGLSQDFFPSFIYTTTLMKGKAGKTYHLEVVHGEKRVTGETTIPARTELNTIEAVQAEDGVWRVMAGFTPDPAGCYGFFSRGSNDSFGYLPVFLSQVDGSIATGPQTVAVTRGSGLTNIKDFNPGFEPGEQVSVRFCTMGREMYDFWDKFGQLTGISYIMTYPSVFDNLPSNLTGGYGYWAGYGTSVYEIVIPES